MTANNEDGSQPPAAPSKHEPLSTDTPPPTTSSEHASSSSSSSSSSLLPTPAPTPDRAELLERARHFLSSPQVTHQDYDSKRRFLAEKGLEDGEIQLLLNEMVRPVHSFPRPKHSMSSLKHSQFPVVPPRMYPAPPPSRLPGLLVGTFKVLSWLAGGSTALLFIYYVRAAPPTPTTPCSAPGLGPASASCFPALRSRRSPAARSRRTKATSSPD
jgi:hypothetical protein